MLPVYCPREGSTVTGVRKQTLKHYAYFPMKGDYMKLFDIIELAKQGYKPNDIKELIALADSTEEKSEEAEQKTPEEEPVKEEAEQTEETKPEEAIDYKKLYEEEKQRTDKLQGLFARKDIGTPDVKSDEQTVLDLVREFM